MNESKASKIALVEVFRSPQGEGYNAGRDAIFIRFAGCNLSCVFGPGSVCDTPYQKASLKVSLRELFEDIVLPLAAAPPDGRILGDHKNNKPMIILTGGEPTLAPAFDDVVEYAYSRNFYIAVETNGTRFRPGLQKVDWICVSPKAGIKQGSTAPYHNHNPQSPELDLQVLTLMERMSTSPVGRGEFRYVISPDSPIPRYYPAYRHYISPATLATGDGMEWMSGQFVGFVPGAVERCLEIIREDPRWRISLQTHKLLGVR